MKFTVTRQMYENRLCEIQDLREERDQLLGEIERLKKKNPDNLGRQRGSSALTVAVLQGNLRVRINRWLQVYPIGILFTNTIPVCYSPLTKIITVERNPCSITARPDLETGDKANSRWLNPCVQGGRVRQHLKKCFAYMVKQMTLKLTMGQQQV